MAAENLQTLKARIKTAVNIAQIAKAMEMISASKIKRAREAVENNRPYAKKITETVERILASIDVRDVSSPYIKAPSAGKTLVLLITPDKGLCGALSDNLFRELLKFDRRSTEVVAMGKKGESFAAKNGYHVVASFPMGTKLPAYDVIYPLLAVLNKKFLAGESSTVKVLYSRFDSMMKQTPTIAQLMPVPVDPATQGPADDILYTFEPSRAHVLDELLPYYIEVTMYYFLINAYSAEQAARMVSMQNAKNNALDIRDSITLAYNKLRQAKITGEILDITNSQFA